jgi:hypothetical protein
MSKLGANHEMSTARDRLIAQLQSEFSDLKADQFAFSLVILENAQISRCGYRDDVLIYPASIIKMFYAVAAYHWIEAGKLKKTEELDRAMRDMIVESSNDATSYVVDLLTGTTSGPELSAKQMIQWMAKRNLVNQHLASRGFTRINANQKPWGDGPYGREMVFVTSESGGRNMLTTAETARLFTDIVQQRAADQMHCKELLTLLSRDKSVPSDDPDSQAHTFLAANLPAEIPFWSKAGWTSKVRHDAACLRLPHLDLVCVIFTENHSKQPAIIQRFGELVVQEMWEMQET